jgi:ABC-type phosphate transport system substrate-binding protein
MISLSARRIVSACIASAATVAVLAAPGVASAKAKICTGENIGAQGSSLQYEAQVIWNPDFNTNTKAGCASSGAPTVKYTSTGSGAGYKAWGEKSEFGPTNAFIGTDNTVNATEKETIESKQTGTGGTVLTIPVLQGAVTIPINLPANCVASSTPASGRLALDNSTLEEVFAGKIKTWTELLKSAEGTGDTLTGSGCEPNSAITVVVREDSSGTTHIFKRYLNLIYNGTLASEGGATHTWGELAEGSLSTTWPTATAVKKPANSTGPEVLKLVAATPGSIGYANLADARNPANGGFTGQSPQRFWALLENEKKSKNGKVSRKFADPSSNGDVAAKDSSNCKKTVYSNGTSAFPPPSVGSPWNEVTTELTSKTYSLCGLTYDLVLKNYEAYPGTTAGEATTVKEYMTYVINKKGGQSDIKDQDYSELPKELVAESEEGINEIG